MQFHEDSTKNLAEILENWIRGGRSKAARHALEDVLRKGDLSRFRPELRLQLARLCRRSGIPAAGLRILHPRIRPTARKIVTASPSEWAEYAGCLSAVGGEREALEILALLDPRDAPEKLLFEAFVHFSYWDYEAAIAPLRHYVSLSGLTDYNRLVGNLNLCSALVVSGLQEEALPLLSSSLQVAIEGRHKLLFGNALMLQAEAHVDAKRWQDAKYHLHEAADRFSEIASIDALYLAKWNAVVNLHQQGPGKSQLRELHRVRQNAIARTHWETVRDCDFHRAVSTESKTLALHLYSGTPFSAYRKRIEDTGLVSLNDARANAHWDLAPERDLGSLFEEKKIPAKISRQIDLLETLKPGQILWRLTTCLLSDFYRPFRMASLYAWTHPNQRFHPRHSSDAVHQALRRMRILIQKKRLPLSVTEREGAYRLESSCPARLLVHGTSTQAVPADRLKFDRFLSNMKTADPFFDGSFKRKDLEQALGLSERSAAYLVKNAVSRGWIHVLNKGSSKKYKIGFSEPGCGSR